MGGGWLLLTVALAGLFWLFEIIRARITKRPPPWKVPRESGPTPPLARALWGGGWQLPEVDPKQRRRAMRLVLAVYLIVAAVAAAAALATHAAGGSAGAVIAASILAVVAAMVIALCVGITVELRNRR